MNLLATKLTHISFKRFSHNDLAVIVLSAPNNRPETLNPLLSKIKEVIASIQTGEIVVSVFIYLRSTKSAKIE